MAEKVTLIDWGDGTVVKVRQPDLSGLPAVMCPPACYPADGDKNMEIGTGKKIDTTKLPCSDGVA